MIEIPRSMLRQFRAVLRRSGSPLEAQREVSAVRCRTGSAGLALEAVRTEVAIRCQTEGSRPEMALTFPVSLLAQVEGRKDDPVTLERVSDSAGRARWAENGVPRVAEFELVSPDSVLAFPDVPRRFTPMPPKFGPALAEVIRTTARESVRYALTRVQLRGKDGSLVGTDGRQLLLQRGFTFPWSEDLLVPAITALTGKELLEQGPIGLGRTKGHVALRLGPWTFLLAIDTTGHFPNVDAVIPKARGPACRLVLDPADAESVARVLSKLPSKSEEQAVTLDLATPPAIRFRVNEGPVTEVGLPRSTASGKPVRLVSDRRFLLRALELGFGEIHVQDAETALCCRDAERMYVWMPLGKSAALPASADVLARPGSRFRTTPRRKDTCHAPSLDQRSSTGRGSSQLQRRAARAWRN